MPTYSVPLSVLGLQAGLGSTPTPTGLLPNQYYVIYDGFYYRTLQADSQGNYNITNVINSSTTRPVGLNIYSSILPFDQLRNQPNNILKGLITLAVETVPNTLAPNQTF